MNQIACPGDGSVVVESEAKGVVTARNRNGDLVWSWHAPEPGYQVWSVESSGEGKYTGAILSYPGSSRNEEFVYLDADGNVLWNRTLDKSTWDVSQSEDGKKIAIPGSGNISYFDETGKQLGTTVAGRGPLHTVLSDNGTTIAAL
ncbi:MAG TPA: hypothetical protein VEI81_00480, partial [Methanoregula sp.]|nr:hypothetical protein [Methanoregula sp.]